jgi:hypothetical protein
LVTFLTRQQNAEKIQHAGMSRLGLRRRLQSPLRIGVIAALERFEGEAKFEVSGRHEQTCFERMVWRMKLGALYRGQAAQEIKTRIEARIRAAASQRRANESVS